MKEVILETEYPDYVIIFSLLGDIPPSANGSLELNPVSIVWDNSLEE